MKAPIDRSLFMDSESPKHIDTRDTERTKTITQIESKFSAFLLLNPNITIYKVNDN